MGKQNARQRSVERGCDGSSHATAEQREALAARQFEAFPYPGAETRAQVHGRSVATDRGTGANGEDADRGRSQASPDRHFRVLLAHGLHHVSGTVVASLGHESIHDQADQ